MKFITLFYKGKCSFCEHKAFVKLIFYGNEHLNARLCFPHFRRFIKDGEKYVLAKN